MKKYWLMSALTAAVMAPASNAATQYHRLIWDQDPSQSAVIGFSPDGSSQSPYVKFGYSTNESQWQTASVSNTQTFAGSLQSHFIRLTNLNADSEVFYRVCDQDGCGQRLWFKTAANSEKPFVAVAGGDTRTGWTNRRQGNQLIAKIRPLFVMHGGDYTNDNNASEMREFLKDWQLTLSSDTINGVSYKRIYPLVVTHGNHEDNDYRTLCRVFGADYNNDGNCSPTDTYGAFNVTPLLRVYTLNSQFKNSGWSSYASAMNSWLTTDMQSNGSQVKWRIGQYHKPMFPHYTGKSENTDLFNWWASTFYDNAMNMLVESDTHINKVTKAIRPSGSNFSETTQGGTVYVGEGSWGAPARSANDPKSWTIDLASIQQFKVITVKPDEMQVRTAQFDNSASTLTREQRQNDAIVLPNNVNWWHANNVGESLKLVRNSDQRTVIDDGSTGGGGNQVTLQAIADTFITKSNANTNYNGSSEGLLADGQDSQYGEMKSLIRFDLSQIPSCATVTNATLKLNVFNPSSGTYQVSGIAANWTESGATWSNTSGGSIESGTYASFTPSTTGVKSINFASGGVAAVQSWISGNNYGVVVSTTSATDGIDISSREQSNGPSLTISYDEGESCGPTEPPSDTQVTLNAAEDTFVSKTRSTTNYNGSSEGLLADKSDSTYGEMKSLIKFDLSQIPSCATISDVKLKFNVFNPSSGSYKISGAANSWNESNATWSNTSAASIENGIFASFTPSSTGMKTLSFNSTGKSAVQSWLTGTNNGVVVSTTSATDGIDISSREQSNGPQLVVTYSGGENCAPTEPPVDEQLLENGNAKTNLSASKNAEPQYYIDVPANAGTLAVTINGGDGDADLYVKYGAEATKSNWDCRPYRWGNSETCTISSTQAGRYYIMLHAYEAFSGLTLQASY